MRRAVADSDDEDEDLAAGFHDEHAETALHVAEETTDAETTVSTFDGTIERSIGSTEQLRRAIESAERGLVSNSTSREMATTAPSASASPSMQANKRTHTAALGSDASAGQEEAVKRTKTTRVYGAKRQPRVTDHGSFEQFNGDDVASATSQSARFTEHSGVECDPALPSGSIQDGFLNHEPNVMFQDSGSTVADNSSAEQRLLEEALRSNKGLTTSAINGLKLDEHQSSSIPWSPSADFDTTRSSGPPAAARSELTEAPDVQHSEEAEVSVQIVAEAHGTGALQSSNLQQQAVSDSLAIESPRARSSPKAVQSPIVEIPRIESEPSQVAQEVSASAEKVTKSRKRKAQQDDNTDPLNSDDRAIGLPKEQYKPRLSKRRATQSYEEPIDFSVRPEKAARVKRTKTTDAVVSHAATDSDPDGAIARAIVARLGTTAPTKSGYNDPVQASRSMSEEPTTVQDHSRGVGSGIASTEEEAEQKQPEQGTASPSVEHDKSDDAIFVKPAKPTLKTQTYSKAKRSQTTIFEDHVDFKGSQRSPSLSQQQATRKSVLEAVQNEAKPSKTKRKVVVEDEDEDDEPDKDEDADQEEKKEPKKKGRGRPAKSTTSVQPKTEEKILDDSEDDVEEQIEPEELPKKRGRGRPAKATDAPQPDGGEDPGPKEPSGVLQSKESVQEDVSSNRATEPSADANTKLSATPTAASIPTPSPEKQTLPAKTAKPSPTPHSPIKSSLSVPLRVGLSRSHRIPSLLRMGKPPKR